MEYKYHQDEPVWFDNGQIQGLGRVVGCGSIDMPLSGKVYLVQAFDVLPTDEYPFNVFSIMEIYLMTKYEKEMKEFSEEAQ